MTPAERRRQIRIHSIIQDLRRIAEQSDALELTLQNGGLAGNMLYEIANDFERFVEKEKP